MIANIGYALLFLQITLGILLPVFSNFYIKKISSQNLLKLLKVFTISMLLSAITSQLILIYAYVKSDYSLLNVYQNSHHLKPLIYRIAGSWGNHEGSMLLLITTLCFFNFAFNIFSNADLEIKKTTVSVQSLIIALFAFYTCFASNPFELNDYNFLISQNKIEGLGLNPLLQDIGLALHPPMLYTGYLGFSIVFSITLASLIHEKFNYQIQKILQNWLYFAYGFLTLGIMLGAWWAYRELGWGGYWFFDPVENISLMPWLCATALIHSIKLANHHKSLQFWSAFLAILCFILCLFGIFLTRSGILTSVHSFAVDANRSYYIFFIVGIIGCYGLFILGKKSDLLFTNNKSVKNTHKLKFFLFLVNNYFLLGALFVVLLGTLYPIALRAFSNEFITVGANYYQQIFGYLIIPFLMFFCLAGYRQKKLFITRIVFSIFISGIILAIIIFNYPKINFLQMMILFSAIIALTMTISSQQKPTVLCAHLGFIFIILGIIFSSFFGLSKEQNLKLTQKIQLGNYLFNFKDINYIRSKNFIARQAEFEVTKSDKFIANLQPQLRFYPVNNQTTNEASIYNSLLGDLYVVIGNKDDDDNYAVRLYFKPFIYLIWLGAVMIFLATLSYPIKKSVLIFIGKKQKL